jgi:hypothetical protein
MVFHIKESLSHKDLSEKRLAPILDAYEVVMNIIQNYYFGIA